MDILLELREAGENLSDEDIKFQIATILSTVRIILKRWKIIIYAIYKMHCIIGLRIYYDYGQLLPSDVGHAPRHSSEYIIALRL